MGDTADEVNEGAGFASSGSPSERLAPIVDALLRAGNVPNSNGFVRRPDGIVFTFIYPIDFALVHNTCEIPPGVVLSEASDTILDRLTWCAIEGPGAADADIVR